MTDISADNASRIAEGLYSHNAAYYPNTLEAFATEGHDVIYALRAHIDAQDAKIKALVEALGKLCFEVAGLQAFEQGVRHEIGNANYADIMTRLEAGGVALEAIASPSIAAAKETT